MRSKRSRAPRYRALLAPETRLARLLHTEWSDPVARSGIFLLLNTAVTGLFGLVYWLTAARLFSQSSVGRAAAVVSAMTLLAGVGQLNLSGMLMRFLPDARDRSRQLVLTAYAVACVTSVLLAVIALLAVGALTSHHSPLRLSPLESAIFAVSVAATVVFTLQDSVLIALRRTVWIPIENGAFGLVKIVLLLALAGLFSGWAAIFAVSVAGPSYSRSRTAFSSRCGERFGSRSRMERLGW